MNLVNVHPSFISPCCRKDFLLYLGFSIHKIQFQGTTGIVQMWNLMFPGTETPLCSSSALKYTFSLCCDGSEISVFSHQRLARGSLSFENGIISHFNVYKITACLKARVSHINASTHTYIFRHTYIHI